jgi:cellulose synthase/poly-beta-1,6-N-acetylglucosamine synthase-like glycosyltransferase
LRIYIVIPSHNEANYLGQTLDSLVAQTQQADKVLVVNDNSTDSSAEIISTYTQKHTFISTIDTLSSNKHQPGSKVINAFYKGFRLLDNNYDIIMKLDADIVLPKNYLSRIVAMFSANPKVGMASGLCFVNKNGTWIYETIADKNHVRGPIKAYRKQCFHDIGGLQASLGWDTADVLLAQYHKWQIKTDKTLHVKHLKPTGIKYNVVNQQGAVFKKLRYGFVITCISALKIALNKRKPKLFFNLIYGYLKHNKSEGYLVNRSEGEFIRKFRWNNMRKKITGS